MQYLEASLDIVAFAFLCYYLDEFVTLLPMQKICIIVEIRLKDCCIFYIINTTKQSELQSTKVPNPLREKRGVG